jgi:hypothetical protein
VCDFTVAPSLQWAYMGHFWKAMFANDHVFLNEEHITTLKAGFTEVKHEVGLGSFPYLPLLECAYYYYVGRKTSETCPI